MPKKYMSRRKEVLIKIVGYMIGILIVLGLGAAALFVIIHVSGVGGAGGNSVMSRAEAVNFTQQFFQVVNVNRTAVNASPLLPCPSLSRFAELRFNHMVAHYQISHYGYENDSLAFFGYTDILTSEEVLYFEGGVTPVQYAIFTEEYAPIHWNLLMSPVFHYYGYYIGWGPVYNVYITSTVCIEIPGPNINITQYYINNNCTFQITPGWWLVVELANQCPTNSTQ